MSDEERVPGDGWIDLGSGRFALELSGGIILESTFDDAAAALVWLPDVDITELVDANGGIAPDDDDDDDDDGDGDESDIHDDAGDED